MKTSLKYWPKNLKKLNINTFFIGSTILLHYYQSWTCLYQLNSTATPHIVRVDTVLCLIKGKLNRNFNWEFAWITVSYSCGRDLRYVSPASPIVANILRVAAGVRRFLRLSCQASTASGKLKLKVHPVTVISFQL